MTKEISRYEDMAIGSPDVIKDGKQFVMVYAQGGTDHIGRIGLAISPDGGKWDKHGNGLPVFEPTGTDTFDSHFLDTPCIEKVGDTYYLYYMGMRSNNTPGAAIGAATSTDLIHWTRVSAEPVLTPGEPEDWDGLWVESPTVRVLDGKFFMWYTGVGGNWLPQVGLATSSDGVHWTKSPKNPVLGGGSGSAWDDFTGAVPVVIRKGGAFQMFFAGISKAEVAQKLNTPKLGLAISNDGVTWKKYSGNPIITAGNTYGQPAGPYNLGAVFDEAPQRYMVRYETGSGFGLVTAAEVPAL